VCQPSFVVHWSLFVVHWCCTSVSCVGVVSWCHTLVSWIGCCWLVVHWLFAVGHPLSSAISHWLSTIVCWRSCIVRCWLLAVRIPLSIICRWPTVVHRWSSIICCWLSIGHCWSSVVGRRLSAVIGHHPSSLLVVVGARPGSTWAGWSRGFSKCQATCKEKKK